MIWPIHQKLLLEDATPRNLVIGKDIADDRLYANIFGDGGGCHLHVIDELLESPPVFAAQREVDWLDLQEVMAGVELGCGEGYNCAVMDPMYGDLPDAVGDAPKASGDGVAASVHRSGCGGSCARGGFGPVTPGLKQSIRKEVGKTKRDNALERVNYGNVLPPRGQARLHLTAF